MGDDASENGRERRSRTRCGGSKEVWDRIEREDGSPGGRRCEVGAPAVSGGDQLVALTNIETAVSFRGCFGSITLRRPQEAAALEVGMVVEKAEFSCEI